MNKQKLNTIYESLKAEGLTPEREDMIRMEIDSAAERTIGSKGAEDRGFIDAAAKEIKGIYDYADLEMFQGIRPPEIQPVASLQTLDELLERDKIREKDGFPRRIKLGKIVRPGDGTKEEIVIVPSTTEPKFYHAPATDEEESTGGSGEGEEGEVIGEQQAQPKEGEGEGEGAGQGEGANHDIESKAFDLGKVLTEQFQLPNLKKKGTKRSFSKYVYDLTDRNRGFGQVVDKKATLKKIIETNIILGNVPESGDFDPAALVLNPRDIIYRILSKEKDFESQAVVFFVRDYSGSMQGKPTEVIATQHLFIYSWLAYQYQNNVTSRFILHDNEAKEVPDFITYYNSQVAGGTSIFPAYELVNKIVDSEQLARDNNIYIFHGTDGDDWDSGGEKAIAAIKQMLGYANRFGITVARNSWATGGSTTVEKYIEKSGLLKLKPDLIKMDSMTAADADENRIIRSIKTLVEEV